MPITTYACTVLGALARWTYGGHIPAGGTASLNVTATGICYYTNYVPGQPPPSQQVSLDPSQIGPATGTCDGRNASSVISAITLGMLLVAPGVVPSPPYQVDLFYNPAGHCYTANVIAPLGNLTLTATQVNTLATGISSTTGYDIYYIFNDNLYADNGGQFVVSTAVTTPDPPRPPCVYTLTATAPNPANCVLSVVVEIAESVTGGNTANPCALDTSYSIVRQTDSAGPWTALSGSVAATGGVVTYTDSTVTAGHSYIYQVTGNQTMTVATTGAVMVACVTPPEPGTGCNWTTAPTCSDTTWTGAPGCAGTVWVEGS